MTRSFDRSDADLRPVEIEPGFVSSADGSALISVGGTRVICTASVSTIAVTPRPVMLRRAEASGGGTSPSRSRPPDATAAASG